VLESHDDGSAAALVVPTVSAKAVDVDSVVDTQMGRTLVHVAAQHAMGDTTAALVKAGADVSIKVLG